MASDLTGGADFSNMLASFTRTTSTLAISVAANATETSYGFTDAHRPANADWETGTITVKVQVTSANSAINCSVQADRLNSAGSVQESSTATAEQTLSATGTFTFTVASTNWTAGACTDRLRIRYIFRNTNTHTAQSVTIQLDSVNTEVTLNAITLNSGSCIGVFLTAPDQFDATHTAKITTGATTSDGVSTNLYLDALIASWDTADKLTLKVEKEQTGTSFDDVANSTQVTSLWVDPENPRVRRTMTTVYDPTLKRLIAFGGWNGTTRYNDTWELILDNTASPKPQWRQLSPTGTPPSARNSHIAFFDATLNRMIVGFGSTGSDNNDMYSLSFSGGRDGAWTTLSPGGSIPAVRSQTSICNDTANKKAYLVCGWGAARLNDIQEFDYSTTNGTWTQKSADGAAAACSRRNDTACVWDATNSRIVLFGGYNGTARLNDTWTYVPGTNTWVDKTAVFSGTAPSIRELMYCALDTTNNRMVIYGGRNGTASGDVRADAAYLTLSAGSETWNVVTFTADERPAGVWTNAGCYDPNHQLFLIFGGMDSSLEVNRHVLAIDCSNSSTLSMKQIALNQYLRGRDAMGYAYNPDLNHTLVVGGFARVDYTDTTFVNGDHTNDMWIYRHATTDWIPAIRGQVAISMTNREGVSVIYDTNRNRFIIFGGLTGNATSNNTYYNDTWELKADANNLYTLTKLAPTSTKPSARWLHAAGYDATNDRMIIFGGDAGGAYLNDLYALSFSGGADGAWSTLSPTGTPPSGRRQPAYAVDTGANELMISHGGTTVSAFAGDTFKLTLTAGSEAWSGITGTGAPTSRRGMTAVYRATDDAFYFFGGYNGTVHYNDSYKLTFGGTPAWSTLSPTGTAPETRRSHLAGYSPTNDKMMIFGGREDTAPTFDSRANTYEMNLASPAWAKIDPKIYIEGSAIATSLTAGATYHWQTWATGSLSSDSAKSSYGGNAESATDFQIAAAGTTYTQSLSASVSFVIDKKFGIGKGKTDIFNFTETFSRNVAFVKSVISSLAVNESISLHFNIPKSDAITFAESLVTNTGSEKVLADLLTFTEAKFTATGKGILVSLSLGETHTRQVEFYRTMSEALAFVEAINTNQSQPHVIIYEYILRLS